MHGIKAAENIYPLSCSGSFGEFDGADASLISGSVYRKKVGNLSFPEFGDPFEKIMAMCVPGHCEITPPSTAVMDTEKIQLPRGFSSAWIMWLTVDFSRMI